jgi:hypothetical protein
LHARGSAPVQGVLFAAWVPLPHVAEHVSYVHGGQACVLHAGETAPMQGVFAALVPLPHVTVHAPYVHGQVAGSSVHARVDNPPSSPEQLAPLFCNGGLEQVRVSTPAALHVAVQPEYTDQPPSTSQLILQVTSTGEAPMQPLHDASGHVPMYGFTPLAEASIPLGHTALHAP